MFHRRVDEHVELRLPALTDSIELFALVDRNREHLRRWLPWVDANKSPGDSRAFVATTLKQYADRLGFSAMVVVDGAIAGVVGFHGISWPNRHTSMGYWLAERHQGRGIMTRSCRVLVRHAFLELDLHRIEIRVAPGNARSRAIPERLGFKVEGQLRQAEWLHDHFVDHVVYGLLRGEWKSEE